MAFQSTLTVARHPAFPVPHSFFGQPVAQDTPWSSWEEQGPCMIQQACTQLQEAFPRETWGGPPVFLQQCHSATALLMTGPQEMPSQPADALILTCPGLCLGLYTADCAPLFLYDPQIPALAVVHAGWRGALHGIVEHTLALMDTLGSKAHHRLALLGPTIHPSHYPVGEDFFQEACALQPHAQAFFLTLEGKLHFDLPGYVLRCVKTGVATLHNMHLDTFTGPFFSHRRTLQQGGPKGYRNISLVSLPVLS